MSGLNPEQRAAVEHGDGPLLVFASAGCHAPGQGILMHDGSVRAVDVIAAGDRVMGWDSTPRRVLATTHGTGPMYRVTPVKGASFVVNDAHLLTLVQTVGGAVADVALREFLSLKPYERSSWKLLRCAVEHFDAAGDERPIDPYFLGALLGDGSIRDVVGLTKPDPEMRELVTVQAERYGLHVRTSGTGTSATMFLSSGRGGGRWTHGNPLLNDLRRLGLVGIHGSGRFVPCAYKVGPLSVRLEMLAGLLDTDGHLCCGGYDFISASRQLADDLVFLARSCGLAAYMKPAEKHDQNGNGGTYYRVSVSGDCSIIPCRLPRKKALPRKQKKNVLRTGIAAIEPLGDGEFYGFTIEGDGRYLLDDFTVTHNSGKTSVLTHRVAHLIDIGRVEPARIFVVTFTNKASRTLKDRLAKLTTPEAAKQIWVGTFHSLCARLLRRYPDVTGRTAEFTILDESDQKQLIRPLLEEAEERAEASRLVVPGDYFDADRVLGAIEKHKRAGLLPGEIDRVADRELAGLRGLVRAQTAAAQAWLGQEERDPLLGLVRTAWVDYEEKLHAADALDFSDLILYGVRLAEQDSLRGQALRRQFAHVLVDESQDLSMDQYALARALAGHGNLCLVGDDFQQIFTWRGADSTIIRTFKQDFPAATIVKMERNYRSSGHVIAVANAIGAKIVECEPKKMWTERGVEAPVTVVSAGDERDEAAYVAEQIAARLRAGDRASDCAVLYRMHVHSRAIENELRTRDIRYRVLSGTKFFQRAEVRDALAYLRLVRRGADMDLRRVVDAPPCGVGATTLKRAGQLAKERRTSLIDALRVIAERGETAHRERQAVVGLLDRLARLRVAGQGMPLTELVPWILRASYYLPHLTEQQEKYAKGLGGKKVSEKKASEVAERIGNLGELVTDVVRWTERRTAAGDPVDLGSYLERVALLAADDREDEADAVSLLTLHSAKGQEYANVFIVAVEKGIIPIVRASQTDADEEERRLFYVGITRAMRRLWISHAHVRYAWGEAKPALPSPYLADLPTEATVAAEAVGDERMSTRRATA